MGGIFISNKQSLICTPFTGHPVKGVHIITGRFLWKRDKKFDIIINKENRSLMEVQL